MSAAEAQEFCFLSMSSGSMTIQSSATFFCVSWPAFCLLELRFFFFHPLYLVQ